MSTFEPIPVKVIQRATSQVTAILNEIDEMLAQLTEYGKAAAIDLRSLPLFPGDYASLKDLLGEGEVHVTLNTLGPSEIIETTIPGVWWCTHFNEAQEKIAEFIEITRIPELLLTTGADLQLAREKLARLVNLSIKGDDDAS